MSKKQKTSDRVLGISATPRAVHAVLLEQGSAGPEVVRRFSRQRAVAAATGYEEGAHYPSEPKSETIGGGDDFTIEFGDGNASNSNLFLGSEFGVVDEDGDSASAAAAVASFDFELGDILAEVTDAGYGDAVLAFTLSASEAPFADVQLPAAKSGRHDRATLIEALSTQHSGAFDADRVVFLPMSPTDDTESRHLALFTKPADPVSATLTRLREDGDLTTRAVLLDGELSVLMGLARAAKDVFGFHEADDEVREPAQRFDGRREAAPDGRQRTDTSNTLIVRAGTEDTLVLFLRGGTVHHAEILRSLTAFDQTETLCSRVLLQQDEHGRGEVDHILLLSEEREAELSDTFKVFFPDAQVELLRAFLPEIGQEDDSGSATALVSACGVALRVLNGSPYADSYEDINFLPRKLSRSKFRLPISAHMVALSVLIVVTSLFFMTRFSTAETEIATYRERLEDVAPDEVNQDITVLQARIDSMEHLYATYTRAIEVLDTLLIGSDRWSRLLENTSREASRVSGFWIESFQPDGGYVTIQGNATSRDHVVAFASRVDGIIESLAFSEIREWPVYSYSMAIPVADSLPRAAVYLRDNVRIDDEPVVEAAAPQATYQNEGVVR
jgi:hypothetical protein